MAFLPNEIWLAIVPYCELEDAWLSLRSVSHQLKSCVEQHFHEQVLPELILNLPMPLSSREINDYGGTEARVTLRVCARSSRTPKVKETIAAGMICWSHVVDVEPAERETHMLHEWRVLSNGQLRDRRWNLFTHGTMIATRLKEPYVGMGPGCGRHGDNAQLSFEWMPTMTALLRRMSRSLWYV
ncbi:hypothetical protein LTR17_025074 [Elasticomyces elasticus]|nr:hypothetical protein LTR17_025074 [Elasticomyces elasticus]